MENEGIVSFLKTELYFQLGSRGVQELRGKKYNIEVIYKPCVKSDAVQWDTYGYKLSYKGYRQRRFRSSNEYLQVAKGLSFGEIRMMASMFADRIVRHLNENGVKYEKTGRNQIIKAG